MSYILDALRKADADRERDPSRGIHAQPVVLAAAPAGWTPARTLLPLAAAAAAAAAVVLLWPGESARPPHAAVTPSPGAAAIAAVVPSAPVAAPAPAAPAQAVLPPPPPPREPPPARAMPVAAVKTVPATAAAVPAAAASTPAAAPQRAVAINELPPDLQRDLPKLAISGGVFSENAAQRMLIVGGQVVNEGAELAPGLVLEQIRAKSAVLRFRGWRYTVAY